MRDLTRTRTAVTRARVREIQRLEKVLEDAGIKLSIVVSDICGVTADVVIAETGADMSRFPSPGHLASWAGVSPGHNFLSVKYRRLVHSRGKQKALVAIERTLLTITWTMLTSGALYDEPGPDWYTRQHPERAKRHALRQLQDLGYNVTITPTGAA